MQQRKLLEDLLLKTLSTAEFLAWKAEEGPEEAEEEEEEEEDY